MKEPRQNRSGPSARDFLSLLLLFLLALFFIEMGAQDAYRTGFRLYTLKQLEGKSQVAMGTVVEAEHPWYAPTIDVAGNSKWYRVRYDFEIPGGRVVQGEDWIRRSSHPPMSLRIAYLPTDPAANRIHTSNNIYDEHEDWGQGVVGGLGVLAGGFFLILFVMTVKMWREIRLYN